MDALGKIHKAALSLFFRYGIRHVTMDEIAGELGMSKKTIYRHYREKDDLVTHLCETEMARHEVDFDKIQSAAKDAVHEIMLISSKMRDIMQQINPAFFLDLKKFHAQAFARFHKFRDDYGYRNILTNIKKGMEYGLYRQDLDPSFVATYRLAQIDMLMFGDVFHGGNHSLAVTHEKMMDLFVHGIATAKGQKLIAKYRKKHIND